jgi:RNA polymerase sigma-70 factor, ECF subfamily
VYDSPSDRDRRYCRYRRRDYKSDVQLKLLTALTRSPQTHVSTPADRRSGVYSRMNPGTQTETPYIKRKRKPKRITYSSIFGILRGHEMRAAMQERPTGEVTVLLHQMRSGDSGAAEKLIPLVVDELRRLARLQLRDERPGHTLQPTALVNEAYLRLVGDQARDWQNRAHFIGVSVSVMKRILIDHARRKQALKRGSEIQSLEGAEDYAGLSLEQAEELLALNVALDRLEKMSSRQRQVVELRYFGGLSTEETAEVLKVSPVTVKRDWVIARAWLKGQLRPEGTTSFA